MAVSIMPDLGSFIGASPAQIRQRCEITRMSLEAARSSLIPVWQDCNNYVLPWRARFQPTDNRGNRRNQNIIDSTATMAQRTLSAGMTSGITNPARPWFQIATADPALMEQTDVKEWCHEVQLRLGGIFVRSNLYDKLPVLYGDLGTFGTAAILILEDPDSVIRVYDFQVGSYAVGNDDKMLVRTFSRVFTLTVDQVVKKWGNINAQGIPDFLDDARKASTSISLSVQNLWRTGTRQLPVQIVHVVQPNVSYDGTKIDAKYKLYEEVYYEQGVTNQQIGNTLGLLQHSGYDEWPLLCARWDANSEDVYATNWPALTALGDIKELQLTKKRLAQAVELWVKPPMTGPSSLRNVKTSLIAGDITYNDPSQPGLGFRPAYEINNPGAAIQALNAMTQDTQQRIKDAFYVNLILMMAESDRREITAREIDERHEEKMLAIGPVLSRLNVDVLDPLIERTFHIANRRGLMPPPPPSMQNATLQIEYISIMQQAQKQVSTTGLERGSGFVAQYAQVDPSVLDLVNGDELITEYFDAMGVAPKVLRSEDEVAQIRQEKQKQQQAAQAAQNAPAVAGAAKDASQATTSDGSSVLDMLLNKQNARKTLSATTQPPPSVLS